MEQNHLSAEAVGTLRSLLYGLEDFPLFHQNSMGAVTPNALAPTPTLENCMLCGRHRARRHIVVGQVVAGAKLCIVGAGPSLKEDESNRPFHGARGELLDKMLNAIGFARHEVTLLHSVKCYSPSGIEASDEDLNACYNHLQIQIRNARPQVILAMGDSAARMLVRTNGHLKGLRGKKWEWDGIPLFATHEAATLLERPELKREAWEDLKLITKALA